MAKKTVKTIKATLFNLGREYKATGKTVEDVISKIEAPIIRGHSVLTLEKGDLKKERILNRPTSQGLFGKGSPTQKQVAVKNIISLFEDFNK